MERERERACQRAVTSWPAIPRRALPADSEQCFNARGPGGRRRNMTHVCLSNSRTQHPRLVAQHRAATSPPQEQMSGIETGEPKSVRRQVIDLAVTEGEWDD